MADIRRFLDTVGDGTGDTNANVDGSVTPVVFRINGPAYLNRMLIQIREDTDGVAAGRYGGIPTLLNGVRVQLRGDTGTVYHELDGGHPVRSYADWRSHCYDGDPDEFGTGDNFTSIRWTFSRDTGRPLPVRKGRHLAVVIADDLTGLVSHTFKVGGQTRRFTV